MTFDEQSGQPELRRHQRVAIDTALKTLRILAKFDDADAKQIVPLLEKVAEKHPVEK